MKLVKRATLILLGLLFLLISSAYILVISNKKVLQERLSNELKSKYGLKFEVDKIQVSFFENWPRTSVRFTNVRIQSLLHNPQNREFFNARSMSLSFNLRRMLGGEFIVSYIGLKDARIDLIRLENGTSNFEIFKKSNQGDSLLSKDTANTVVFEIENLKLENTSFNFTNRQKKQRIAINLFNTALRIRNYSDGARARLVGNVHVLGLLFNPKNGVFLKNKETQLNLDLAYFKATKTICVFPPSTIKIEDEIYRVASLIDVGEKQRFALIVENKTCSVSKAAELLAPNIKKALSAFVLKNTIDVRFVLVSSIGRKKEPFLLVDVMAQHIALELGKKKIPFTDLSFKGRLLSSDSNGTKGNSETAAISFAQVTGNILDLPMRASVNVTNLKAPILEIHGNLLIEASRLKFKETKHIILSGSAKAQISFQGPAKQLNDGRFLDEPMKFLADVDMHNFTYRKNNKSEPYSINGKATARNKDVYFENLILTSRAGKIALKGRVENFVSYLFNKKDVMKFDLVAKAGTLDLNSFFNPDKLEAAGVTDTKRLPDKQKPGNIKYDMELKVQLAANKILFKKFVAEKVNGNVTYKDEVWSFSSIKLNTCNGRISGAAKLVDLKHISADISAMDLNINTLFTQCDNFGQEAVQSENIKGNLSLNAKFKTDLEPGMKIAGESMWGEVDLKLKAGHLINFEPIQNLSRFLVLNRNLDDVEFSELNETFRLKGYVMEIDELEISSNLLNLYVVNGVYDFKGVSNINVLVPWSNLKTKNRLLSPKNTGKSAQSTRGLKLNFQGPKKNLKISFGHKELK
ncbi:MAG: AsmA-like C-terminal region-containing protein [bacterium]|nr:AsmA-like C-terminal region-containing protein [bacterium]